MNAARVLWMSISSLLLCAGCSKETPEKPTEPKKVREECHPPSMDCYNDCYKREAQRYCPSCCFDNLILCDEGKQFDFERCKKEP